MAKTKELFNVKGKNLTANEKAVYDFVVANGVTDYKAVAADLGITPKSASSTLARLQSTHGLLKKKAPIQVTTYEVAEDVDNSDNE